jgi:DNA-directed RNA polymerase subunit M/transcription elongation factor TFIIS
MTVVLAMAFSALAMAQAYKWTDKSGRVQYGDVPAGDASNVTRLKASSSGYAAPAAPEAKKDAGKDKDKALTPEQAFKKRQQERAEAEQKADKERAEAGEKRANCDAAQASLRQLQSGQRVATVNASGERVFIDDEQRSREIQRAQASVSSWCK